MNPKTGLVSPQFHLVFDDIFETVPHLRAGTVPENWEELVTNSRENSTECFYDITKTWFDGEVDITDDSPASSIPSAAMQQPLAVMQQPAAKHLPLAAMQQPATTQHPPAAMQQPAAKQQPLGSMQQPATTQQPPAAMQQHAAMQPLYLAESPIFQQNSSAESPNLEYTANNDNFHIEFNEDSSIP